MSYHVVSDPPQVCEVLRRHDDFVPTNALTSVVALSPATLRALSRVRFALPAVLASATGERHRRVRQIVTPFFTPEKIAAIRPRVAALTRERCQLAATALAGGPVDLVETVARHIPPVVLSDLTGIRCPDLERLKRWSQDSLELFWGWPDEQRQLELADSACEFYVWLREQVLASATGDSLFGALRTAGLSVTDVCSLGYFLVIAGQETTSQLISTAFYRALDNRALDDRALDDRPHWDSLAEGAPATDFVRGVLATESSVHTWRRTTGHDTQLDGTDLPAGTEILLQLSGNHPADTATSAYGLAFGYGIHRCLGAKLAEMETVTVLEETARALPGLTLTGPTPEWQRLLSFQAPRTVRVERRTQ